MIFRPVVDCSDNSRRTAAAILPEHSSRSVRRIERRRDGAAAELTDESIAKSTVEHDVDDEVDGGVDGQHGVRYLTDRLDQIAIGLGISKVKGGHNSIRDDTHDEHDHNDDKHDGYAPAHCNLPVVDAQTRPAAQGGDDGEAGNDEDYDRYD